MWKWFRKHELSRPLPREGWESNTSEIAISNFQHLERTLGFGYHSFESVSGFAIPRSARVYDLLRLFHGTDRVHGVRAELEVRLLGADH